jgi:hypothetical protein
MGWIEPNDVRAVADPVLIPRRDSPIVHLDKAAIDGRMEASFAQCAVENAYFTKSP